MVKNCVLFFTGQKCVTLFGSLMLDGVMSFLHVINIRHVKACVTVKHLAGILQCNIGKLEGSEGCNCFFIVFCVKN